MMDWKEAVKTLGTVIASAVGVTAVIYVVNSFSHYHKSVDGICDEFNNFDTSSLEDGLPHLLFEREIPKDVMESQDVYYIFGPKFSGKSTVGQLIAVKSGKQHQPFLYAYIESLSPRAACLSLGKQIGYYAKQNSWYFDFLDSMNDNKLKDAKCDVDEIWDSIEEAVSKLSARHERPLVIVDGIEYLKADDLHMLCRKMRTTSNKIKYIIISTPDVVGELSQDCKDGAFFERYYVGQVSSQDARNYLTETCKMSQFDACRTYNYVGGYLLPLNRLCSGKDLNHMVESFSLQWLRNLGQSPYVELTAQLKDLIVALLKDEDNDIDCQEYFDLWKYLSSGYGEIITLSGTNHCQFANRMFVPVFKMLLQNETAKEIDDAIVAKCKVSTDTQTINVAVDATQSQE